MDSPAGLRCRGTAVRAFRPEWVESASQGRGRPARRAAVRRCKAPYIAPATRGRVPCGNARVATARSFARRVDFSARWRSARSSISSSAVTRTTALRGFDSRRLRARLAARVLVQDTLLLPELPSEARASLRRMGRGERSCAGASPAVRLHRASARSTLLCKAPRVARGAVPHRGAAARACVRRGASSRQAGTDRVRARASATWSTSIRIYTCLPPTGRFFPAAASSHCRGCRHIFLPRACRARGARFSGGERGAVGGTARPHARLAARGLLGAQRGVRGGRRC